MTKHERTICPTENMKLKYMNESLIAYLDINFYILNLTLTKVNKIKLNMLIIKVISGPWRILQLRK